MKKHFSSFCSFSECLPKDCSETKLEKLKKLEKLLSQERSWGVYLVCEKAVFPVFPVFPNVFQKFVPQQNWKNCFLRRSWGLYLVCEKAVFPVFPVFPRVSSKRLLRNKIGKTGRSSGAYYLVCEKAVFPVYPVFSVFPSVFQKIAPKQNWKNWEKFGCLLPSL